MALPLPSVSDLTTLLISIAVLVFVLRRLRSSLAETLQAAKKLRHDLTGSSPDLPTRLSQSLVSALPGGVIFPHDAAAFKQSMNSYWAQQESEVIPACVVRPRDIQQLCMAVSILKREYDERRKQAGTEEAEGIFAVRSGGHSSVSGAASIQGGVVIDLGLFSEVEPSEDGSSVTIGAGARWRTVAKVLDEKGIAVVGGRNSDVGVGGLILGGGLSFFSPRFGLVCSNIISYEVVLASGSVTTASASTNPDLWRALKGGSNNFGIVTRFTARSFPCTKIWSGFLYMPGFQAPKVLAAFYECVTRADSGDPSTAYAAGPMTCFSYIQKLGIQTIATNLAYTKPPENKKKWPSYWRTSSFGSLWYLWSTCRVCTLASATDEMNELSPSGKRQVFATTTIKNDHGTITAAYAAYSDAITSIRRVNVRGLVWTLVLQPLLSDWTSKGDVNPLGLQEFPHEPLVIVSFTANWANARDDQFVKMTTRRAIEQIDAVAAANKTSHRYRFLNYCAEWQRPFESYGEENLHFLQRVSRTYDPDGLFQKGCAGGFKLNVEDYEA